MNINILDVNYKNTYSNKLHWSVYLINTNTFIMKNALTDLIAKQALKHESFTEKPITIAYLLLVHRLPKQFLKLFQAIYTPENVYLIHVDNKTDKNIKTEVYEMIKKYSNVFILKSRNVIWGGYSMVQVELDGIDYLLKENKDWDYFINLSGQDYPLKNQKEIQDFLRNQNGGSFLKFEKQPTSRPETMNRIENYFTETIDSISPLTTKRPFMEGVTPYVGGQWMMLSRKCCEFISTSPDVDKFKDYYKNTLIADESFFQTVLVNTSFNGLLINQDKRAIIWIPDGDIKLRPKTMTISDQKFLNASDDFFARKFDSEVDSDIVVKLEINLAKQILSTFI